MTVRLSSTRRLQPLMTNGSYVAWQSPPPETLDALAQAACEALGGNAALVLELRGDAAVLAGTHELPEAVRTLIEARTGDAVYVVGPDYTIVHWDYRMESLTGALSEEAVGKPCYEAVMGEGEGGDAADNGLWTKNKHYAAKSRRNTGTRFAPHLPGRASYTPAQGVPQNRQRPSLVRFQSLKRYQSRPIRACNTSSAQS